MNESLKNKIGYKYLVTGDSISRGVIYDEEKKKYTLLENNYVSILQSKLNGIVSNTARFGNTLIKGISRLKNDTVKDSPDIVLIEYGGNDCDFDWNKISEDPDAEHLPKTDFGMFEKLLRESVDFLKNRSIIPVLMTLPPLNADKYFKWVSKKRPVGRVKHPQMAGQCNKNILVAGKV